MQEPHYVAIIGFTIWPLNIFRLTLEVQRNFPSYVTDKMINTFPELCETLQNNDFFQGT